MKKYRTDSEEKVVTNLSKASCFFWTLNGQCVVNSFNNF